tara:strand:+ start:427 stop:594 length:168 start_codon:yes stop_codon:yes gene_type:complete
MSVLLLLMPSLRPDPQMFFGGEGIARKMLLLGYCCIDDQPRKGCSGPTQMRQNIL